jgi:hypothetical protein
MTYPDRNRYPDKLSGKKIIQVGHGLTDRNIETYMIFYNINALIHGFLLSIFLKIYRKINTQ